MSRKRRTLFAKLLFDGKIAKSSQTRDGSHWGRATLHALDGSGDECTINIQNEFTLAQLNGRTIALVPDLISVLDRKLGSL